MTLTPAGVLEALLFAAGEPLQKSRLCTLLEITPDMLTAALGELSSTLSGRGLTLVETASEVELRTSPEAALFVQKLRESELSRDLGKAGLEALAVILYQPEGATRSEIDWVRGVNSGAALRSLVMRGLVRRSEDQSDKRRARFTATVDALAHLGVTRAEQLPRYEEMKGALQSRHEVVADATL